MLLADAQALTQLLQLATAQLTETITLSGLAMTAVGLFTVSLIELRNVAAAHQAPRKLLGP